MPAVETAMTLSEDQLREVDHALLDYLTEGRMTPAYGRKRIVADGVRESITGQYVNQRLRRFEEHGHVRNLRDTGLYELVSDPREGSDQ